MEQKISDFLRCFVLCHDDEVNSLKAQALDLLIEAALWRNIPQAAADEPVGIYILHHGEEKIPASMYIAMKNHWIAGQKINAIKVLREWHHQKYPNLNLTLKDGKETCEEIFNGLVETLPPRYTGLHT
jgi:hypothetical protein